MINVQRLTPLVPDIQELQVDPGTDTPDAQSLLAAFVNEDNAQRFVVQGILAQRLGEQDTPEYCEMERIPSSTFTSNSGSYTSSC